MRYSVHGFDKPFRPKAQPGRGDSEKTLLLRLLAERFGALPEAVQARVGAAEPMQLELWMHRMLQVDRLEQVFVDS